MKAYWFEPADGTLKYGDGRKPEVGVTHRVDGPLEFLTRGLHASIRPMDALQYSESPCVWVVELSGEVLECKDKCRATERTYIRRIDAEAILFECSCRFALSVAHLWDMPPVVRAFLETGNEDLRAAAWCAARPAESAVASAIAAARAAASAAESAAVWDTAWRAARHAAWAASPTTMSAAPWHAAWDEMNTLLQARLEDV